MFFEGDLFVKSAVIFDPIDRIWIPRCFQPSVHSTTASSTTFYLLVWKITISFLKISGVYLLQDVYIYIYTYIYMCAALWCGCAA